MDNNADRELARLLSEWATPVEVDAQSDISRRNLLWAQILTLFESGQTTELSLLQTLTSLFRNADLRGKSDLIYLMDALVYSSTERDGYGYPELFWLVVESNILFEFSDISDVGRFIGGFLCRTGGVEATRSYLIHKLLSKDTATHANALVAFYATGHSLQSLRAVVELAPEPNNSNAQLYVFIYIDAWTFLAKNRDVKLTPTDKLALTAFFSRGLALMNSFKPNYCQKALAILEETHIETQ
ncbi:MAG: hypothetical protein KF716_01050 [Anaerolineae bacterium]|nr:hypothetical protein [Anaerolineae bacterium]